MKKLFISMIAALAITGSATAQDTVLNNPDNRAYFGIRVAGEVTCPGEVSEDGIGVGIFKNGGGIEFGGIYNIPIVANFYVEPGLKLYYNTYSLKDKYFDLVDGDITGCSVRKFGMRIPVMAGYHFDFTPEIKVHIFTGPELEIGFSAKEKLSGRNIDVSGDLYSDEGGMKRVDVLWGIGAGVTYQKLYFGVSGSLGMCNMMDESDTKFHENRVSFTLGYNF